ncbi:transglutaminase domain-containing protein (plasmid) [Streptomyces viridifaciens]|nr:transglutaminase domain-containing protein [Streptomyces viridifaciens]
MELTDDAVQAVIRRIRMVPDKYRTFTEGPEEVAAIHQISDDLFAQLMDLGLPSTSGGRVRLFDRTDLENVGLSLGLPCPRRIAMQWWSRSLDTIVSQPNSEFHLRVSTKCPQDHDGACKFAPSPYLEAAVASGSLATVQPGLVTARVRLEIQHVMFDGAYAELFDRLDSLTFHIIPETMPPETVFAADTGLADCRIAAKLLVDNAADHGLRARPAAGFFMSPPFPMRHVWTEFWLSGSWVPADPFLLRSLSRWGITDLEKWPVHRSPAGLLWALQSIDSIDTPVMFHGGRDAPASLVIRKQVFTAARA